MIVLVAPNAYKGCLSATVAARIMGCAVARAGHHAALCPLADGGDGTLEALKEALGLRIRRSRVTNPRGRPIWARWGFNPMTKVAVIEMAQASGLALLAVRERNPCRATSAGTGELLNAARRAGAREIYLCLGGSATVDGGLGILQALGARLVVGSPGAILNRPATGDDLSGLVHVEASPARRRLRGVRLRVLCDVNNPLLGPRGAAPVYGPQKGATPAQARRLAAGLQNLARLAQKETSRPIGRMPVGRMPGGGAAGGAAAGLAGFLGAKLESGFAAVSRAVGLEKKLRRADMVFSGEGRVDGTSWEGKALGGLAALCRRHRKPLVVFAGSVGPGGRKKGVAVGPINPPGLAPRECLRRAGTLLGASVRGYFRGKTR